jgi:sigma-E factor negative regulatory protein RseA
MTIDETVRDKDSLMNMSSLEREQAERISALVDGEHEAGFAGKLARDEAAARRWARYQSIGEMLRSPELVPTARDEAFMTRMRLSLAAEPVVIAPRSQAALGARIDERKVSPTAPNAGSARALPLKTIGMAGGLAALVALAMSWSSFMPARSGAPAGLELSQQTPKAVNRVGVVESPVMPVTSATQVADKREALVPAEPALVVVQTANGAVIRNARLDQYFTAHGGVRSGNGLGGGASMAGPAAFVRGASIDSADKQ